MLQTIHDKLKGVFAFMILGALGVVFVFWGVDASVGSFAKARGIEVNGRELDVEGVRRQYQDELSRYQVAFGAAGVPEEMRAGLQTQALEQAVRNELLRQRTRKLRFTISDEQVLQAIQQIPAFQVAGRFSADAYHAALRGAGMRPEQFEAEQREFAIARQLDRGISSSTIVLPGEVSRRVALLNEIREIAWVVMPTANFQKELTPDEAAITSYYDGHLSQYMTEEQATLEYVELNIDSLASAVATSEAQLREYYEANKERFSTEGRRQVRHILVAVKDDEAAAEAKAGKVYDRVSAGEDFAALARELSDDTGSAAAGGDLGWALRGDFVAAFADAVWGMRPGETRGPVRTEFGWHVIRLEQAEADNTRSFAEVRVEIEPDARRAEVEKQFGDQQEMLETLAFESAGNLAEIAARMNLPVRRIERFTRQGGGELGGIPALVQAVFAAAVLSGSELRTVELAPGRVVAVRVASHDPARARPLEEVRDMVVAAARLEAARRLATVKAAAVAAELSTGGEWMRVIGPWRSATAESATFQPRLVRRDETLVPAEIMQEAFRARRPEGRPRFGTARLASGDAAVWMVGAVRTGSLAALSPEEREQAIEAARESANIADAAAYVSALRAAADVDFNPQLFE